MHEQGIEHRITVVPDPEIGRLALRRFWLRYVGWVSFAISGLLFAELVFLVVFQRGLWWVQGGFAFLFVLSCVSMAAQYWTFQRRYLTSNNQGTPGTIVLGFSESGFTIYMEGEQATITWERFLFLWQFPDCWILVPALDRFIPLRAHWLDEATKAFLVSQVRQSGGRVLSNPGLGVGLMFQKKVF